MGYEPNGTQTIHDLRQVAVYRDSSRVPTGVTKPNVPSDPDYIPPIENSPDCTIPCSDGSTYSGGQAFPTTIPVVLGTSLGNVQLHYIAGTVPDKFEVWFDGIKVIDTGYVGDPFYQTTLNAALADRGLPPETIDGTLPVGTGTRWFTKTTSTSLAIVKVYGPLITGWTFVLDCPVPSTTTTTTTTSTTTTTTHAPVTWSLNFNTLPTNVTGLVGTFAMKRTVSGPSEELLASHAIDAVSPATCGVNIYSTTPIVSSWYVELNIASNAISANDIRVDLRDFGGTIVGTFTIPASSTGIFRHFYGAEYTDLVLNAELTLI